MTGYCILARRDAASGQRSAKGKSKEGRYQTGVWALTDKVVVLVTCADLKEAKRIASAVVEARLAACVNIIGARVRSTYRWKGKVEAARETLLLIKTSRRRLAALRAEVERLHGYDVPEFIALPITAGSPAYLNWIDECLAPAAPGKRRKK
ncbi:MAG: divalent-cation tolerance protein CutA [Acidobacteria bacterium]|nr:divalent-cation tolerance protein CutA [Acidobacteriota bacterium]MBI3663640.1 divalent-cation tolerance protein CutA [Acidobacteriota bacterium]